MICNKINVELIKDNQWDSFFTLQYLLMRKYNAFDCNINKELAIKKLKHILHEQYNIKKPPYYVWVATVCNKYLGHVWGCVYPMQIILEKYKLTLFDMIVYPGHRRKGIGSALFDCVNNFCQKAGIEKTEFQVKIGDEDVDQFCRKNGYKRDACIYRLDIE